MTKAEADKFLIDISYKLGNIDAENLTEKDGEKMREAMAVCREQAFEAGKHDAYLHIKATSDLCFIPVSEGLPKKRDEYLITLGNGDIFNCEFDPDFTNEEHENGAFVYYSLYHDSETFAVVGVGEEAVDDVVAWMPLFKWYEPKKGDENDNY